MSDDEIEGLEALVDALTAKNKQLQVDYDKLNAKYTALKNYPYSGGYYHGFDQAQIKFQLQIGSLNYYIKYLNYYVEYQRVYVEYLELASSHAENQLREISGRYREQQLQIAARQAYTKDLEDSAAVGREHELEIERLEQYIGQWTTLNEMNNRKIQELEIANQQFKSLLQKQDCRNHVDRSLALSIMRYVEYFGESIIPEHATQRWKDFIKVCNQLFE